MNSAYGKKNNIFPSCFQIECTISGIHARGASGVRACKPVAKEELPAQQEKTAYAYSHFSSAK